MRQHASDGYFHKENIGGKHSADTYGIPHDRRAACHLSCIISVDMASNNIYFLGFGNALHPRYQASIPLLDIDIYRSAFLGFQFFPRL